jgi:hypothetical protein
VSDPVTECGYYDKTTTECDCIDMDCCGSFCPYERLDQCPVHNEKVET